MHPPAPIVTKIGGDRETGCIWKDQPAIVVQIIILGVILDSLIPPNLGWAGSGRHQRCPVGRRAERSGSPQTVCFAKGSAQGPRKKSNSNRKPVFSRRNLGFQPLRATKTHQIPAGKPTPPSDRPRSAPESPRQLPRLPGTSRVTTKIREPVGDLFFGPGTEFSGPETLQNHPGTLRKPTLTVGRAVERSRVAPTASLTPGDVQGHNKNPGTGRRPVSWCQTRAF